MSIKSHRIGFLGLDSYDLILLIAKYLDKLGQRVLIMDYSKFGRLSYCIPAPASLSPEKDLIQYNNLDFIRYNKEIIQREDYNYIIIDFGWDVSHHLIPSCEMIYIVTDLQQQNMEQILGIKIPELTVYILLKNYFHANNIKNVEYYFKENHFSIKNCYLFPASERDLENMVMLQYYHDIKLNQTSKQLRNLIYTILINDFNFGEKEVVKIRKRNKNHLKERRGND